MNHVIIRWITHTFIKQIQVPQLTLLVRSLLRSDLQGIATIINVSQLPISQMYPQSYVTFSETIVALNYH